MHSATFSKDGDSVVIKFTYHAGVIDALKKLVPKQDRSYNPKAKSWTVDMRHYDGVYDLFDHNRFYITENEMDPPAERDNSYRVVVNQYIEVTYIQDQGGGLIVGTTKMGTVRMWDITMPYEVVRKFSAPKTYFDILGIDKTADDALVKSTYRKTIMLYHPDRNPDGRDKFEQLTTAYKVLQTSALRKSYLARLTMVEKFAMNAVALPQHSGILCVSGHYSDSILYVQEIHSWTDLVIGGQLIKTRYELGRVVYE